MPFRLKLRLTELDLPYGELTIGRGTDCFLRIDDDLVSRRHARLMVGPDKVLFEDLGSRNGSKVNGARYLGPVELHIGDSFEIGAQVFQLITGAELEREPTMTMMPHRACRRCQLLIDVRLDSCPHCKAPQQVGDAEAEEISRVGPLPSGPSAMAAEDTASGKQNFASSFRLVTGVSDKLLAFGRVEEAERMIAPRLREALARVQGGEAMDAQLPGEALARGVKLAMATGRDEWYAWIFLFARATARRLDDKTIDELHARMLAHRPATSGAIAAYFSAWGGDDAETVQFKKRLEALARFCRD
jgi:pSer/pThr/pTyr-binding forkhead associated (FHA) protein